MDKYYLLLHCHNRHVRIYFMSLDIYDLKENKNYDTLRITIKINNKKYLKHINK